MNEKENFWEHENGLHKRLKMYKDFRKQNPNVKGIIPLLTIISVLQIIYYLVQIIYYFRKIDVILAKEYKIRKSGQSNVKFSPELEKYLLENVNLI